MSGFAGIIRLEPSLETAEADRAAIARMAEAIAFRGPDAQQQWSQNGASFAFSLLTTGPAPQSSSQPVTVDGETWLLGDVRLDRRSELIEALNRAGYPGGPSVTDEEIVLLAWKSWRANERDKFFQDELHGEFAFAIWEPAKLELNCFRDAMGCRPFYFHVDKGTVYFSNTLNALKAAPRFEAALDHEFIADFLLNGWCPRPDRSIYRAAQRLGPGRRLTFSRQGSRVALFQALPVEEPLFLKREEEYIERYQTLLEKSVADRLPDCSAAIFLSGGMDSSAIAALASMQRLKNGTPGDLHGVTGDALPLFDDEEGRWATRVAASLNMPIHLSHHGDREPFSDYEQNARLFPEPIANPFREVYLKLYSDASRYARVVFLGYGGDDVLRGGAYSFLKYMNRNNLRLKAVHLIGKYVLRRSKLPPLRGGLLAWARRALRFNTARAFPDWLNPGFVQELNLRERFRELTRDVPEIHPLHPRAYAGLATTYWAVAMDNEDAAFVGSPVETRAPLLDFRLLRFLLRLPTVPWCIDKELPRRALQGHLPPEILSRPKRALQQDPLLLHFRKGDWAPANLPPPHPALQSFVDWRRIVEGDHRDSATALWALVPVMALHYWLRGIEMRELIV